MRTTKKIGPKEAQEYLETMGPPSYPVDPHLVSMFAKRMKSGAWIEGPEPLLEDLEGNMISGRRRMHAVVESGVEVEFVVIRGEHSSVFVCSSTKPSELLKEWAR